MDLKNQVVGVPQISFIKDQKRHMPIMNVHFTFYGVIKKSLSLRVAPFDLIFSSELRVTP